MIGNGQELVEAPFVVDFFKSYLPIKSAYDGPIKLKKNARLAPDYSHYAYTCPIADEMFNIFGLSDALFSRMIELLAPLTLYLFSQSSKYLYYRCLDIRGLEFKEYYGPPDYKNGYATTAPLRLNEIDGRMYRRDPGWLKDMKFSHYQIVFTQAHFSTSTAISGLNIVKRYKVLQLFITMERDAADLYDCVFHPKVENVIVKIAEINGGLRQATDTNKMTFDSFTKLLNHCKTVKTVNVHFRKESSHFGFMWDASHLSIVDNPKMEKIKALIENWAKTTSRLEIFIFCYKNHVFKLYKNELKRLVKLGGKWYYSDTWDIDTYDYTIEPERNECHMRYNKWFHYLFYGNVHFDELMLMEKYERPDQLPNSVSKDESTLPCLKKSYSAVWRDQSFWQLVRQFVLHFCTFAKQVACSVYATH